LHVCRRFSGILVVIVLRHLALGAIREPLGFSFLTEIIGGACRFAGAEEIVVGDAPGARPVEFGEDRTARIGGYGSKASRARAEAEAMQRDGSSLFWIGSHSETRPFGAHCLILPSPTGQSPVTETDLRLANEIAAMRMGILPV
jgi:hypothetical protein